MKEHFTDLRDSLGYRVISKQLQLNLDTTVSIMHKWKEHGSTVNGTQFDTCQKISKQCGKPGCKYCKEATNNYSQSIGRRFWPSKTTWSVGNIVCDTLEPEKFYLWRNWI